MSALFSTLLYIVFFLSALLLIVVILLQEPKGGGIAEAFGGMGGETFGVRERGINKFTAIVASVFLGAAVLIHLLADTSGRQAFEEISPTPPGGAAVPATDTTTPTGTGDEKPKEEKPK